MDHEVQRSVPEDVDAGQLGIDIDEDALDGTVTSGIQAHRQAQQRGETVDRASAIRWQAPVQREVLTRIPTTLEPHQARHLDELFGTQTP